jgi:hypothetical protein
MMLLSRMCSRLLSGSARDPDHGQQARDVAVDLVADHLLVVGLRCLQRADDVERMPG